MKGFIKLGLIALILVGVLGLYVLNQQEQEIVGADGVLPAGLSTYNLSGSGVSGSATSMTLSSLTLPQTGQKLIDADFSNTFYLTLEPGNRTRQEFVSCTTVTQNASTATLSGCSRGLSPVSPFTASTTLQFAHAGGTQVIFSNSPQFYNQFAAKDNDETITGDWLVPTPVNTTSVVNKAYADSVANQGAATSTESLGGIVELATLAEVAASFDGGTNKPTVIQAKHATSTPTVSCSTFCVVVATAGKIAQGFLDLTSSFTWTGEHTYNSGGTATTTFNRGIDIDGDSDTPLIINGQSYTFPTSDGTASSTVLMSNGNGSLSWNLNRPPRYARFFDGITDAINGYSTSTMQLVIPAGAITASSTISFNGVFQCDNSANGDRDCTAYLAKSTGEKIITIGGITADQANITTYGFNTNVISTGTVSAWRAVGSAINLGPLVGVATVGGTVVNAAFTGDLSAEQTFVVVIRSSGTNTITIFNAGTVIVNP